MNLVLDVGHRKPATTSARFGPSLSGRDSKPDVGAPILASLSTLARPSRQSSRIAEGNKCSKPLRARASRSASRTNPDTIEKHWAARERLFENASRRAPDWKYSVGALETHESYIDYQMWREEREAHYSLEERIALEVFDGIIRRDPRLYKRIARAYPHRPQAEVCGEAAPNAKLTEDKVRQIRAIHKAGGVPQKVIAHKFSVSQPTIAAIVRGDTWRHLA